MKLLKYVLIAVGVCGSSALLTLGILRLTEYLQDKIGLEWTLFVVMCLFGVVLSLLVYLIEKWQNAINRLESTISS